MGVWLGEDLCDWSMVMGGGSIWFIWLYWKQWRPGYLISEGDGPIMYDIKYTVFPRNPSLSHQPFWNISLNIANDFTE